MKKKITCLLILTVFISLFSVTGCYKDDEARVTIHIQRNDLVSQKPVQKKWFIDRILEFFSTAAEASFPPLWNSTHGDLTLTVSSSSFNNMIYTIPSGATSYSVIVPAGNSVTFTITSTYNSVKNWGGYSTQNLKPGEDTDITINMSPMLNLLLEAFSTSIQIQWDVAGMPSHVTSFRVYKSINQNGPYEFIGTGSIIMTDTYSITDNNVIFGTTYYYRVSAVSTSYGEGVLCDPKSGTPQ